LTTANIAHAFLVPESTMAQRLVRAKHKIQAANIPYREPLPEQLPERLDAVLAVLYLIFNEGYSATAGDAFILGELCHEAIRLARVLIGLIPDQVEIEGLLALMLLQDSRAHARTGPDGRLLTLEMQDRSLWNQDRIREGIETLERALKRKQAGPY